MVAVECPERSARDMMTVEYTALQSSFFYFDRPSAYRELNIKEYHRKMTGKKLIQFCAVLETPLK